MTHIDALIAFPTPLLCPGQFRRRARSILDRIAGDMAMMNHKDMRTTLRYDRSDLEHKRDALKLLPSLQRVK